MTIDFWGLGLQAINVLILVWLLRRLFWRPVAAAIVNRQQTARSIIDNAEETRARADAALAEATEARAGIAQERAATLDKARLEAETASKAILAEARTKAEAILAEARKTAIKDAENARKNDEKAAADLSLAIAARLLGRMHSPAIQTYFLSELVDAIAEMPADDRKALVHAPDGVEIVSAVDTGAAQGKIEQAVQTALGGTPAIRFTTDPALIAGLELRSPHFILHNSWQADLARVRKAVTDAA